MENKEIADMLEEIADLIELQDGNPFRIRAYRSAARTVRDQSGRVADMVAAGDDLTQLPNIGTGTAEKIQEMVETGTSERLEEQRRKVPAALTRLLDVPGLGPARVMLLHDALGIETLDQLRSACEQQKVRELPDMGEKMEQKILRGIETLGRTAGRFLWRDAEEVVRSLASHLDSLASIAAWEVAGSFRRRQETVGDLDILLRADDRERATEELLGFDEIRQVDNRGSEKVSVRLNSGMQVDFRFFEERSFGAALLYFTGSKEHNIALRRRVQDRDWKLNEYGLTSGGQQLAGSSEEAVYSRLGMAWVPPELREDRGEIEAAEDDALPELITIDDVRGDLQCHTTASDGTASIEEMAQAARDHGLEYLAITDHSKRVTMANGLDEDRLRKHADAIRKVDQDMRGFRVLAGVEVDILKSGRLDLDEEVLSDLDWVIASIHYDLELSEAKMTDRLLAAIGSGVVHAIAHPTGRVIGRREPIRFNAEKIFEACAKHGVRLEINASPERLDLPDVMCKAAREAGVKFCLGTDSHKPSGFATLPCAVHVARRGWLTREHVLNTVPRSKLDQALKRNRR